MASWSKRTGSLLAVVVLALGISSCTPESDSTTSERTALPDGELTSADSPLARALGGASEQAASEDAEKADATWTLKVEEAVARCMAQKGFDYIPYTGIATVVHVLDYDQDATPLENAQRNGYWITSGDLFVQQGAAEEIVNPNTELTASMSEAELAAYTEALVGELASDGSPRLGTEHSWQDAGCRGAAQHEMDVADSDQESELAVYQDPQWAHLWPLMGAMYNEVEKDPRIVDLRTRWSACMGRAGFTFDSSDEARASIQEQVDVFWINNGGNPDYAGPSQEELAPIATLEIEIAVADVTCADEIGQAQALLRIEYEYEQAFVEAHSSELEALAAALDAARR